MFSPQCPTPNIHALPKPFAVTRALKEADADIVKDIDGIAFTRDPGMSGCLSVCSNAAKSLASALRKPLIGVHHMVSFSTLTDVACTLIQHEASARLNSSSHISIRLAHLPILDTSHFRWTYHVSPRLVAD